MKRITCILRLHDWTDWYDTRGRASGWRWTRYCRRCSRYDCKAWVGERYW